MNNLFFHHELHPRTMRQKQESTQPKMTNGPSDLFSIPGDEFAELVWDNGQIVMQSQSSRFRKSSCPSSVFSSRHGGVQEKDNRRSVNPKFDQSSAVDDFASSRHSPPYELDAHGDDMVPWINYPIDEVLATETMQNDYCAEFLNEFSAFNANPLSAHKNAIASGRNIRSALEVKNANNVEPGHASKASLVGSSEPCRTRASQSFQLPQQCQSAVPNSRSTKIDVSASARNNVPQEGRSGDMLDRRLQNQGMSNTKQLQQPSAVASWMNFSNFARPAALAKIGLKNAGGLKSIEKVTPPASINPISSTRIESANGIKDVNKISGQSSSATHKLSLGSAMKAPQGGCSVEHSNTISSEDALKMNNRTESCADDLPTSSFAASAVLCRHNVRKDFETVVASSSMCSGNNAGTAPSEPKHAEKRKEYDGEDSDYHSEDLQDESVGVRKPPSGRGVRTKRSRATEVHNLSERRRRNRINEKMRALQELIPNCNKVDKASMLDEAIEYLKTLQLQVQIMSMGSGLYMSPMMLPLAMQHMRAPTMAHFPPVGIGMGTGIGLAPGCPMIPIPSMHAPQFSCALSSAQSGLNSIPVPVNPPMYGVQGQGIPIQMPRPPQFSTMVGLSMNTSPVPEARADAATEVAREQQQQNLNVEQNTSTEETQISASTQERNSVYDD